MVSTSVDALDVARQLVGNVVDHLIDNLMPHPHTTTTEPDQSKAGSWKTSLPHLPPS
jgi:hypothetical protein